TENQDDIDAVIVGVLVDPKEARAGIREVHFFPFNPGDKRTALTYIESDGNWHISSKGAPEQILNLCNYKEDVKRKAMQLLLSLLSVGSDLWGLLDSFVPEKSKDAHGALWQFLALLPLFDPPRHDSTETITRDLNLGDQLAIAKETGRRLGMGTNLYPSSSLLGQSKDAARFLFWKFILQFINLFVGFCSFLLSIHSPLLEITTRVWFKQQQCN
ncbi:hypothetical protein S83_055057, partial [Arachis hypogaea]